MLQIVVRFQFEGWHRWPKAPPKHSYLSHPHRHMFHVEARKTVTDVDREIEIIEFKRNMYLYCSGEWGTDDSGAVHDAVSSDSCETIAKDLCERFALDSCVVLEDGENGAEYKPEKPCELWNPLTPETVQRVEKIYSVTTGRHSSSAPNHVEIPRRRFPKNFFWGTEAEGPHRGVHTLFIPGDIGVREALAAISTNLEPMESYQLRNVYFGADNEHYKLPWKDMLSQLSSHWNMLTARFRFIWVENKLEYFKSRFKGPGQRLLTVGVCEDLQEWHDSGYFADFQKKVGATWIDWMHTKTEECWSTPLDDPLFALDTMAVFDFGEEE
jgi:hypothetical protein